MVILLVTWFILVSEAILLVTWFILVSEANCITKSKKVISLLFPLLFPYFRMRKEEENNNEKGGGNNKETGCLIQLPK